MAELTFYILKSDDAKTRHFFCCKLIETIYRQGYHCYLLTDSDSQSRMLDRLLWTFRENSFIPHALYSVGIQENANKVLIGSASPPEGWQTIIVNYARQPLQRLNKTERLLEIVDQHPERLREGQQRYRHYQQQHFKIQTIKR